MAVAAATAKQMMVLSSWFGFGFGFGFSSVSAPVVWVSARRHPSLLVRLRCAFSTDTTTSNTTSSSCSNNNNIKERKKKQLKQKQKEKEKNSGDAAAKVGLAKEKRRTRSLRYHHHCDNNNSEENEGDSPSSSSSSSSGHYPHIPVLLGEVVDVFSWRPLSSFVDCTLGAAGHSSAIMEAHPQLKVFIGMDVDPLALQMARSRIQALSRPSTSQFQAFTFPTNFRHIKSVLRQLEHEQTHITISSGVDGILMDLGVSSMQVNNPERGFSVLANGPLDMRMDPQASLTAEDILNSWPDSEVGRILRDYGEESNWRLLQNKIIQARQQGGLHSTGDLVDVIRSVTPRSRGGRQGWIKTATRVFQALRIAVNDELKTLEDSLYACFDCLAPGGRLAVISFHSLEDRIVKQTFLKIIDRNMESGDGSVEDRETKDFRNVESYINQNESWIRQTIQGCNGIILTKRPITPSEEEEGFNRRSRSAKLRVIQKVCK